MNLSKISLYLLFVVFSINANTENTVKIKIKDKEGYLQCKRGGDIGFICPRENTSPILVYNIPKLSNNKLSSKNYRAIGANSKSPELLKTYEVVEALDNGKVIFSEMEVFYELPNTPDIKAKASLESIYNNSALAILFNSQVENTNSNSASLNSFARATTEYVREKGNEEFEQILSKYNENYKQNRELLLSTLDKEKIVVNLADDIKVNCKKGKDAPLKDKKLEYRQNICGFLKCDPIIKNNKKYNISVFSDGLFALVEEPENGIVEKVDINSIVNSSLQYPIYDRNPDYDEYYKLNEYQPPFGKENITDSSTKLILELQKLYCESKEPALLHFNKMYSKLRENISKKELIHLVEFANGKILSKLAEIGSINIEEYCNINGIYYNYEAISSYDIFSNFKEKSNPNTISLDKVRELFNKAKEMKDIAWKYKKDGCYSRAHLVARRFQEEGIDVGKVWINGDLQIPKDNIHWQYHVAPIVYVDKGNNEVQRMVIDPAIADKPLSVEEWSSLMNKNALGSDLYTSFPLPINTDTYQRATIAFSSANPFRPHGELNVKESENLQIAIEVMKKYKQYE